MQAARANCTLRIPGTLGQARRSWPARGMATQVVGPGSVQLVEDTTLVEPPVPGRADWRVVSAAWAREGPPPPGTAGFQRVCLVRTDMALTGFNAARCRLTHRGDIPVS